MLQTELQDTDSDPDVYGQRREPSQESLPTQSRAGYPESSTPTFADFPVREAYPAWGGDRQIPLSKEEIEDVFLDLTYKFGFQRDSMRNMVRCLFFLSECCQGTFCIFSLFEPCLNLLI